MKGETKPPRPAEACLEVLRDTLPASRGLPPCPRCGASPTAQAPHPTKPGQTFAVRVPCAHQIEDEAEAQRAKAAQEALGRWKVRHANNLPPPPYPGTPLAKVDLKRLPSAAEGVRAAEAMLETWADRVSERSCLALVGTRGTGKTLVVSALAQTLETQGVTTLFATSPWLAARLCDRAKAHEMLDLIATVGFLVVDDLGTEQMTGEAHQALFQAFEARGTTGGPWAWTSNHTGAELAQRWTQALQGGFTKAPPGKAEADAKQLVSRLMSQVTRITLKGPDGRLAQRANWFTPQEEA